MFKPEFSKIFYYCSAILFVLIITCQMPQDPTVPSSTKLDIVVQSSTLSSLGNSSFSDTLGTTLRVGIYSNLIGNIDSVTLTMISADSNIDTSVSFQNFDTTKTVDTLWIYYTLRDTGSKVIYAQAAVRGWKNISDTIYLSVYSRENHNPHLLVSGKSVFEVGEPCSLSFGALDPDAGQTMYYSIDSMPDGAVFDTIGKFFKWIPAIADTGGYSLMFRVIDNGFPALADSVKYDITIVPAKVPPVVKDTSISTVLNTEKTIQLTAISRDGDPLTWSISGDPAHGMADNSGATITYKPAAGWTGNDSFFVMVTDGIWSDTAKVKVTTFDNRIAPKNVSIVVVPASDTVIQGKSLNLSVTMNSDVYPAPTYKWFKNNVLVGTASTYSVTSATLTDAGVYKVVVTNTVDSVTSREVTITVLPTYTLTVNRTSTGGTVAVVKDSSVYVSGTNVQLTATPASGYRFVNWTGDTTETANPLVITMNKNRSLTANYRKQYTLTLTSSNPVRGSVSSLSGTSPIVVDSGAEITISASAASGYKFKKWSVSGAGVVISDTTSVSATVKLTKDNAIVEGLFGGLTFKKQLKINQYTDIFLMDAVQTEDGGYLLVGVYSDRLLIVKLNSQGDVVLTIPDNSIVGSTIRKSSDGYLVSGSSSKFATVNWYAQNGNVLWNYSYGYSDIEKSEYAAVTIQTKDGGYIVGGGMGSEFLMIKTNPLLKEEWDTSYSVGGGGITDCIQGRNGEYVFVGVGTMGLSPKAVKINNNGTIIQEISYSTTYGPASFASIDTTSDGGYIIAGSGNQNGRSRGFIVPVSSGSVSVGEFKTLSNSSKCNGIKVLGNGDFLIAGGTLSLSTGGGEDIYIARINSNGTVLYETVIGGTEDEYARSLQLTNDGGAIIVGTQNWIIKTDENGSVD
ncbi:MAG: hypothetical protein GX640_14495 [Fibrobacter sp.]|nr:hypothetical protein [Fibrobacter sp.]